MISLSVENAARSEGSIERVAEDTPIVVFAGSWWALLWAVLRWRVRVVQTAAAVDVFE